MWFFMNACYLLTILSFVMLVITGLQGHFSFPFLNVNHPTFALLTVIIYLFTQTLVIFFFVGIGVSIKEYVKKHKVNPNFHKRSLSIKMRVYPPLLLNMLLIMILFISGGAVDTHRIPAWSHGILFCVCLLHYMQVIGRQHFAFKESTAIILEMAGVARPDVIS